MAVQPAAQEARPTPERDRMVKRVILVEGSANLLVVLAKVVVGLTTGSVAILAEAVHSLGDVSNNVVAWIVIHFSSQPPDREHPYGHRKFETVAVFGLATLLTVLAVEMTLHAARSHDREITHSGWGLAVMLGVLAVNVGAATWQGYWARRLQSPLLGADARHTFSDVMATLVVIVGWQLSAAGMRELDTILAFLVAGVVFYLAYGLFRKALPELVDSYALPPEKLTQMVGGIPGVRNVRSIRSRRVGHDPVIDVTVTVDPEMTMAEAHRIADAIEAALHIAHAARDVTVHLEPDHDLATDMDGGQ